MHQKLSKLEILEAGTAFMDGINDSLTALAGLEFFPIPHKEGGFVDYRRSFTTKHQFIAQIPFSGPISGDYFLALDVSAWLSVIEDQISEDDDLDDYIEHFFMEALNIAVGAHIGVLQEKIQNISYQSPRIIHGTMHYPNAEILAFEMESANSIRFEGHLCINLTSQEVNFALDRAEKQRNEARQQAQLLEYEVNRRTIELQKSKEHIDNILKSLDEVLLIVNRDLSLATETSNSAIDLIGKENLETKTITEILFPGEKSKSKDARALLDLISSAYELLIPEQFDDLLAQAPEQVKLHPINEPTKTRIYDMKFSAAIEDGELQHVIISLRDKTDRAELDNLTFYANSKMIHSFQHLQKILSDKLEAAAIFTFLDDMLPLAKNLYTNISQINQENIHEAFRVVHTIKGGARSFQLDHVQYFAQETENFLEMIRKTKDLSETMIEISHKLIETTELLHDSLASIALFIDHDLKDQSVIPWVSFLDKTKRSTQALGVDLNKKVELVIDSKDHVISGKDLSILNQTIPHLIGNSIDHGIEDSEGRKKNGKSLESHVWLRVGLENNEWVVTFQDDGQDINGEKIRERAIDKGILPDDHPQLDKDQILEILCHPGFSTQDTVTLVSGRGVGMDAVKLAVEEKGGSLKIEKTDGLGTTFKLRWPKIESGVVDAEIDLTRNTVLLVDDDVETLNIFKSALEDETDFRVVLAANGQEAVEILENQKISVVVTDIKMPQMGGGSLIRYLKDQIPSIPIIVVSGYIDQEFNQTLSELGVYEVILKPAEIGRLIEAVVRAQCSYNYNCLRERIVNAA